MLKYFAVLLILASQLFSQYEVTSAKIDSLLKDDYFKSTIAGISVFNLTKDEPVYKNHDELLLRPASNMKVMTTSTMLYFLGPDYKYHTGLYTDGVVENNKLYGDLYFYGNGDPSFSANDLDSLILMLKDRNISEITGKIYGDVSAYDSVFWGEGWMWDDDPAYYFPYFTPLILNESCVDVTISKTDNDEPKIEVFPNSNYFKIKNNLEVIDNGRSRLSIGRDWMNRKNDIIVKGKINKNFNEYTRSISLFNPSDFFMYYAVERLKANGIKVNSDYGFKVRSANTKELATVESRFGDLIIHLNKKSDNLYAECALKALAYELEGKPASSKKGTRAIDSLVTIIGLNPNDYYFADGSGVSHYNLVSPQLLNSVVTFIYKNHPNLFEVLYKSFPIGGVDGTLGGRMESSKVKNNVHAKTGTLSGVSTLTGYLTADNGDLLSFSIMMQNYVVSSNIARRYQDKICEILTELK